MKKATRANKPQYVYFIGETPSFGTVKIGLTNDFNKRCQQLQTGNPRTLKVLGIIHTKNNDRLERSLHWEFWSQHHNLEWFALSDDIVPAIVFLASLADLNHIYAYAIHTGHYDYIFEREFGILRAGIIKRKIHIEDQTKHIVYTVKVKYGQVKHTIKLIRSGTMMEKLDYISQLKSLNMIERLNEVKHRGLQVLVDVARELSTILNLHLPWISIECEYADKFREIYDAPYVHYARL